MQRPHLTSPIKGEETYSKRKASIGLSAAALMAGLKPNMTPTMIENNVEPTIDINEILVAQPQPQSVLH